jgi:hypothetical protein
MLAIYADLARNNAFDKGIEAGCVLPRIAAGQLAMEVCQGTHVALATFPCLLESSIGAWDR